MVQKIKVVLLGEENVGKTSLVFRLIHKTKLSLQESTIGVSFRNFRILCNEREVRLEIWDTAGQERYNHFLPLYIHHAKIALVCFELPDLEKIQKYIEMIRETDSDIVIGLVATKIDLYGIPLQNEIQMIHPTIERYAEEEGIPLFYTSSKTGQGVSLVFEKTAELVKEDISETIDIEEKIVPESRCC